MRARLPARGGRVRGRQSRCQSAPACRAGRASLLPPPPLAPRCSLASQATPQFTSPQSAIAGQKQLSFNHRQPREINPGCGIRKIRGFVFQLYGCIWEIRVWGKGIPVFPIRGKGFAAGVQEGQSHTTDGRTFRAAPGQSRRMLSPVCRAPQQNQAPSSFQ